MVFIVKRAGSRGGAELLGMGNLSAINWVGERGEWFLAKAQSEGFVKCAWSI